MFDKNFVQFIDAGDNGQIKYENIDIKLVTLSDVIEGFNPNWNEDIDSDEKFKEALQIAKRFLIIKLNQQLPNVMLKSLLSKQLKNPKME